MKRSTGAGWTVGARSETGYVRKENEDRMSRVRFCDGFAYIVSDGMGGHNGGAVAAETTVRTLEQHLSCMQGGAAIDQALRDAFEAANASVFQQSRAGNEATAGMGATAVVCVTTDSSALVAHVGDSRAYLHRRRQLTRLTRDHTRAQDMLTSGLLSPDQADRHPDASVLSRAVGHLESVDVDVGPWLSLHMGDEILLCSDGLCGEADDLEIEEVLQRDESPQRLADRLIELALDKGGNDNVTVQLIRFGRRPTTVDWRTLQWHAATLLILVLSSAVMIYVMVSRLEATLSNRMSVIEAQNGALRLSNDNWKTMLEQQLEAVRVQLASINARMAQNTPMPEEGAAREAPVAGKPPAKARVVGRQTAPASVTRGTRQTATAPAESPVQAERRP